MDPTKVYLLYEQEQDSTREIRLARGDGRLDYLVESFHSTRELECAESMLRALHPSILLEVYQLMPPMVLRL